MGTGIAQDRQPERGRFTAELEARAKKSLTDVGAQDLDGFSADAVLHDEVALILEQIDDHRRTHASIRQELWDEEAEVATELLQMEQRTPRYSSYRYPEREKLQRTRARIREQLRRHTLAGAEKMDMLNGRLLTLMNKRLQVSGR